MHRGTLLAGLMIGLLAAGLATWMVMSPLIVSTYAATMRSSRTGATVECRVQAEEREHPLTAFNMCLMACRLQDFARVGRVENEAIWDFFGTPEDAREIRSRRIRQYARFIPAACRSHAS